MLNNPKKEDFINLHPELEEFYLDFIFFISVMSSVGIKYIPDQIILSNKGKIINLKMKFPKEPKEHENDYVFKEAQRHIYDNFENIERPDDPSYKPAENNLFNQYISLSAGAWKGVIGKATVTLTFKLGDKFDPIFDVEVVANMKRKSSRRTVRIF